MCKELKRLTDLAECKHLNKTDRDAILWAVYQIQPPEVSPETGFDGFEFASWPSVPDKKIFTDLVAARKAKKKVIMNQAYIDLAAPHLHELMKSNITVNQALTVASSHGWQGFRAAWVLNEIQAEVAVSDSEPKTPKDFVELVKAGSITAISQIPNQHRKMIETQFRLGKYKPETQEKLSRIGFAL